MTVVALIVYLFTVAPGLTLEHYGYDGGDLIAAARTLGIPHPTGYPTYILLAWLFTHLPVGTLAYRVNLLSALSSAVTAGLTCRILDLILPPGRGRWVISAAAGLSLAFSPLFWSQAVITEVYPLLALISTLLLWLLTRWYRGDSHLCLWGFGFVLGLGLGNHLTLALMLPPAAILGWAQRRRLVQMRSWFPAIALCFAGLGIYAYLPLAARHYPPVNWGNPQTWDRFLWVITGVPYQPYVLALDRGLIPARLGAWAGLLGAQFGWWGLGLVLAGGWAWGRHDRPFALFALGWLALTLGYAFLYNTGDSQVYLLPALVAMAIAWGMGGHYLLALVERSKPVGQRLALTFLALLPLLSLALHWRESDLSDDWSGPSYIRSILDNVAPDSLVLVRRDAPTFCLWYAVYAERQRPDLAIVSAPLLAYDWYRDHLRHLYPLLSVPDPPGHGLASDELVRDLVVRNWARRPIYATDPGEAWSAWFDLVQQGTAPVYAVYLKTRWEPSG